MMGNFCFAVIQFLDDAEAVEAGHLDVEEDQVRRMLLDESKRFHAVLALADEVHLGKTFEKEGEFVAGRLFVVYNECIDRHDASGYARGQYMRTGSLRSTWVSAPEKGPNTGSQRARQETCVLNRVKLFRGICGGRR